MMEINTSIRIRTSEKILWEQLMDFDSYKDWNPFIIHIKGESKIGEKLEVEIKPPGKNKMGFSPLVLQSEARKEFRWRGHLFFPGIFDGEHYFKINKINDSEVELFHGEKFSGVLSGLMLKMIGDNTRKGFIQMNHAIKEKIENNSQNSNEK